MFSKFRNLILVTAVGACTLMFALQTTQAQTNSTTTTTRANTGYWPSYWNWYDGSYRPYWNRAYTSSGNVNPSYAPNYRYGTAYPANNYGNMGYNHGYSGNYGNMGYGTGYGYNGTGYYNTPYGHSVQLGGRSINWR